MTRSRSFTTAAARRRRDPIVWTIDDQEIRLRSSVDLLEIAPLVDAIQTPIPEDGNRIEATLKKRQMLIDAVVMFVEEEDEESFRKVSPDLEIRVLVDMIQDLMTEYAGGENPTKPAASSAGSSPTTATSTAGALPEGSTSPLSPQTEPSASTSSQSESTLTTTA